MKLRYLFSTILTAALFFTGCSKDETETLDNIQVSDSYLTVSEAGGTMTLNLTTTDDWYFVEEILDAKNKVKYAWPVWLKADKMKGGAGSHTVTFTAEKAEFGREAELIIKVGEFTSQFVRVRQGSLEASDATCQDVIDGPDGKTYVVEGIVTSIANTTYGNWYLDDGTGEIYIYGTLDAEGNTQNFSSLNIEVGDVVKVQGPKTTYNTTVELVDVTVLNIEKALLSVVDSEKSVPSDGAKIEVRVAYKGRGAFVEIPKENDWIQYLETEFRGGVPTKIEPSPADTAVFKFNVDANVGSARVGEINFKSYSYDAKNDKESSTVGTCMVSQPGSSGTQERPFTVTEAIQYAKAVGGETAGDFWVKGIVSQIANNGEFGSFGNGTFWISEDGEYHNDLDLDFEAYRVYWFNNEKWVEGNAQIAVGAEVLICGKLTVYGSTAETSQNKAYVYSVNGVTTDAEGIGTLADPFTAKGAVAAANAVGNTNSSFNAYVKGVVSQIVNNGQFSAQYGNGSFWISEDGTFHNDKNLDFEAYRVLWLGNRKWEEGDPEIAVGDEVVLYGQITLYNGTAETASGKAYVYSHNGKTE